MGVEETENMTQEEYRKAAVDAVRKLSQDVGIPADLKEIVKPEDVDFLAQSAFDDACRPGNPRAVSYTHLSVYTSATDRIDEASAKQAVASVMRFLSRMGIIKYHGHSGYCLLYTSRCV